MNTQELFQHAKDDMLADGKHAPIMYVEYTDTQGKDVLYMYYFANFGAETPLEERMQMFSLGAEFGEKNGEVDFTCLTFIAEAWVSKVASEKVREFQRKYKRPEHDPNRKEYLVAQIVQLMPSPSGKKSMKQSMLRAEIVRPTRDSIDLVPDESELQITRLMLPSYFLSGYAHSQVSDEERAEIIKKLHI